VVGDLKTYENNSYRYGHGRLKIFDSETKIVDAFSYFTAFIIFPMKLIKSLLVMADFKPFPQPILLQGHCETIIVFM
jgi:hypothetical protein